MKIAIATDNHFCEKFSILKQLGQKYTLRLENQLQSLNWFEMMAEHYNCDAVIHLGDFFDKVILTDQELTAMKDIKWNNLIHYFIVGNHESSDQLLTYSSTKALESENRIIISEPKKTDLGTCELCFLPYITEAVRKPIEEYFGPKTKPRIILSHNDLAGIQMGPVISTTGFTIENIEANCDLFLNGHLHNGQAITKKVINLGNLTGKDFGEDALKYTHNMAILDTDTLEVQLIENPYALNFYKLEINTKNDISKLTYLKQNAILTIKCDSNLLEEVKQLTADLPNIITARFVITHEAVEEGNEVSAAELTSIDHFAKFIECCQANLENTQILQEELAKICG